MELQQLLFEAGLLTGCCVSTSYLKRNYASLCFKPCITYPKAVGGALKRNKQQSTMNNHGFVLVKKAAVVTMSTEVCMLPFL